VCSNPSLHQIDIDIAGEAEEHALGADGFLPDSLDNVEYDHMAVERMRKMKKTAYLVLFAMRVAVAAMLVAFNNAETITEDMKKPIKIRVSHHAWHVSMLVSSDICSLIVAGGDGDGQGKGLGVLPGLDQLQRT
jgi:hypothetical protein